MAKRRIVCKLQDRICSKCKRYGHYSKDCTKEKLKRENLLLSGDDRDRRAKDPTKTKKRQLKEEEINHMLEKIHRTNTKKIKEEKEIHTDSESDNANNVTNEATKLLEELPTP